MSLSIIPKKFLGIDIGTSAIKMVEISSFAKRKKLENYAEFSVEISNQNPFSVFKEGTFSLSTEDICLAISETIKEAKIKTRKVIFSIPDFSTLFTEFELPPMTKEEIPEAIKYEAKRYIPLPLKDVTLDWQILWQTTKDSLVSPKILLVSVPNEIIKQYKNVASILNFELVALETEAFALLRSLVQKKETYPISIVDIGQKSTICSIIDKGILRTSHSFNLSSDDFIERLLENFDLDYQTAQTILKKYGILKERKWSEGEKIREVLVPLIESLAKEIENIYEKFYSQEKKGIGKIILSGGVSLMPGLLTYFENYFKKKIEIANPFSNLSYPPILEETLREIGPSYAVAVGAALRGFK